MTTGTAVRRTLLIAVASKHGSTAQISDRIRNRLIRDLPPNLWRIDVADCDDIESIDGYDVVVLGSAVYLGRWLRAATRLLVGATDAPPHGLWLFSSGPIGADTLGTEVMPILRHANTDLKVVEHVMFAGALFPEHLNHWEKGVTGVMHIKGGDFRDWKAIEDWASRIATHLVTASPPHDHSDAPKEAHV